MKCMGSHITFSYFSLACSSLWQFLSLFLSLIILTLLKNTGQLFCRMFLNLGLSEVFPWLEVTHFWQEYGRNHVASLTVHRTRGFVMSSGVITGDVIHPEHVHVMVLAVFLHCKSAIFTFVIYNCLGGETEIMQIFYFSSFFAH